MNDERLAAVAAWCYLNGFKEIFFIINSPIILPFSPPSSIASRK